MGALWPVGSARRPIHAVSEPFCAMLVVRAGGTDHL
jgi:hypothetical protein